MDSLEILFLASFLQLASREIFFVSRLFTISMSMKSSFLDDALRDLKKVHRIIDEFLIDPLCLYARNARTCSRIYQYSSMINTLCIAF